MILRVFIVIQLLLGISNCFSIDPYAHILESETTIQQYFTTFDGVPEGSGLKYVDCVYVDAAHDESSVYADLCAWYPFVRDKGVLCGDDWGWGEELPVRRAVERFAEENNLRIIVPSWNFWILTEKWRGDLL